MHGIFFLVFQTAMWDCVAEKVHLFSRQQETCFILFAALWRRSLGRGFKLASNYLAQSPVHSECLNILLLNAAVLQGQHFCYKLSC